MYDKVQKYWADKIADLQIELKGRTGVRRFQEIEEKIVRMKKTDFMAPAGAGATSPLKARLRCWRLFGKRWKNPEAYAEKTGCFWKPYMPSPKRFAL